MADPLQDFVSALLSDQMQKNLAAENPYYRLQAAPVAIGQALAQNAGDLPGSTKEKLGWALGTGLISGMLGGAGDEYQNVLSDRYQNAIFGGSDGSDLSPNLFNAAKRQRSLLSANAMFKAAEDKKDILKNLLSDPQKIAYLREIAPEQAEKLGIAEEKIQAPEGQKPQGILEKVGSFIGGLSGGVQGQGTQKPKNLLNPVVAKQEEATENLRKEFNALPEVKNFAIIQPKAEALSKALSDISKVTDQELVRYAMLMIEPTSVVREGEAAAIANSQSFTQEWKGALLGALNGQSTLGPDAREGLRRLAVRAYEGHKNLFNQRAAFYSQEAKTKGLDPSRIVSGIAPNASAIFGDASIPISPDPKTFPLVNGQRTEWTGKINPQTGKYVMRVVK